MERILFNPDKHHLGYMVERILQFAKEGENSEKIYEELGSKGVNRESYNGIVDVYYGNLTVDDIKKEVVDYIDERGLKDYSSYKNYVETHGEIKRVGHYLTIELSDKTVQTLRIIDNETQFVHLHPGRYSPNTFRIRANTLKTVIVTTFLALCRNTSPYELALVNEGRKKLGLSPIKEVASAIQSMLETFEKWVKKIRG